MKIINDLKNGKLPNRRTRHAASNGTQSTKSSSRAKRPGQSRQGLVPARVPRGSDVARKGQALNGKLDRSDHWMLRVAPGEKMGISEALPSCLVIIQNRGPGDILLDAGRGERLFLEPGKLRATFAHEFLSLECKERKSATVELQFLPVLSYP